MLYFAIVTRLGDKHLAHLTALPSRVAAWMAVETHRRGANLWEALAELARAGWTPHASHAQASATSETGSYGGACSGVRHHLVHSALPLATRERMAWISEGHYLTGFTIPIAGEDVIVMGSYHRGGITDSVLEQVRVLTRNGALLFLLSGDFNAPPAELEATGWPKMLHATVVAPSQATCHQGKGSTIDYLLASTALSGLLQLRVIDEVPWGPHSALEVVLPNDPKAW